MVLAYGLKGPHMCFGALRISDFSHTPLLLLQSKESDAGVWPAGPLCLLRSHTPIAESVKDLGNCRLII